MITVNRTPLALIQLRPHHRLSGTPQLRSIYYPSTRRLTTASTLEPYCAWVGTADTIINEEHLQ